MAKMKFFNGSTWEILDAKDADTLDGKHASDLLARSEFTAANDLIFGTGNGTAAKKTLAEAKTILGINAASETATGVVEMATTAEVQAGTDTQRAVTPAGVQAIAGTANPVMDGTAAPGTSKYFSRQDHVHPKDTTKENVSNKGVANGYASLDSNGKVPLSQINDSVLGQVEYQGTWNASTNTPVLSASPGSATKGHYYVTSVAGTQFSKSFEVGDWIISNGSTWDKVDNTDAVSSVNGKTGAVTLVKGDVGLGNVDNTSDASKPVSTAQAAAIALKLDATAYTAADVLAKLLTVDTDAAGINATTVKSKTIGTAVGDLMAVGAFGFGADILPELTAAGSANNLTQTGIWRTLTANASSVGAPIALGGAFVNIVYNSSYRSQEFICMIGDVQRRFVRNYDDGTWKPWTEVFHSGNYGVVQKKNASFTLSATDMDTVIVMYNSTAVTITVPPFATLAARKGATVTVIAKGAGTVTFAPSGAAVLNSEGTKRTIDGQYAWATLEHTAVTNAGVDDDNVWDLAGKLKA